MATSVGAPTVADALVRDREHRDCQQVLLRLFRSVTWVKPLADRRFILETSQLTPDVSHCHEQDLNNFAFRSR